jgi:hypothetical protein
MVVVTIITGTAHAGKRNEVLSHLAKVAEYAKEHHIALLTFRVVHLDLRCVSTV